MSSLELLGLASMLICIWFTWFQAKCKDHGSGQTRRMALTECWTSIGIGFGLNFLVNLSMIPLMTNGHSVSASNNWWAGWCYTLVSLLRQYAIRRFFDRHIHRFATWISSRFA